MNKSIKDCLLKILPQEHSWKIMLLKNWENIIGDLKKTVTIEQIKEDVLFLGVMHPAWAQEILALAPVLKQKINSFLSGEYIKTIRIKIKPVCRNEKKQGFKTENLSNSKPLLTAKETEHLNKINDAELRRDIQDFYLKCKSRRQ